MHSLEEEVDKKKQTAQCIQGYDAGACQVLKGQEHGGPHLGEDGK